MDAQQAQLLYEITRHHFDHLQLDSIALHDPLALAVAMDPTLVFAVEAPVSVETLGELTIGQTVVDFRQRRPVGPLHRVCLDVDARRARKAIFSAIGVPLPPE
jgi:inosine-uridine nucleoside N-ribohydrolase